MKAFGKRGDTRVLGLGIPLLLALSSGNAMAQLPTLQPARIAPPPAETPPRSTSAAHLLFVNPEQGDDRQTGTTERSPLRSLTRALEMASPNTIVMLAPGTYSTATGERFPLTVPAGVALQGDPSVQGAGILIQGGGTFRSLSAADQTVTLILSDQSRLVGVTITNPEPNGSGIWVETGSPSVMHSTLTGNAQAGVAIAGNSTPTLSYNQITQNPNVGVLIQGSARPELQENRVAGSSIGMVVGQSAMPRLSSNQILQNTTGVMVEASARPVLRHNRIENNAQDGILAIAQALPDLGTAADLGGNIFIGNGRYDVNANTVQPVIAQGNQFGGTVNGWVALEQGTDPVNVSMEDSEPTPVAIAPVPIATEPPVTLAVRPADSPPPAATPTAPSAAQASAASFPVPSLFEDENPVGALTTPTPQFNLFITQPALLPSGTVPRSLTLQPAASEPPPETETAIVIPVPPPAQNLPSPPSPDVQSLPTQPAAIVIPVIPPAASTAPTPPPRSTVNRFSPPGSSVPSTSASQAVSIPIPVPPPSASGSPAPERSPSPLPTVQPATAIAPVATSIPISVPPPAQPTVSTVPSNTDPAASAPGSDILRVPADEIPVGNVGDLPTVSVAYSPTQGPVIIPPGVSRAAALGLRYRVVVEAPDERSQAQVRSLIPGAFRTQVNGQMVIQAGAYSDRLNAEEAAQRLAQYGLRAIVQPIE